AGISISSADGTSVGWQVVMVTPEKTFGRGFGGRDSLVESIAKLATVSKSLLKRRGDRCA
ncbi:MAG: hypothetical protein ABIW31_04670, partial [Novosphingobium sp.]